MLDTSNEEHIMFKGKNSSPGVLLRCSRCGREHITYAKAMNMDIKQREEILYDIPCTALKTTIFEWYKYEKYARRGNCIVICNKNHHLNDRRRTVERENADDYYTLAMDKGETNHDITRSPVKCGVK